MEESACNAGDMGSIPGSGRSPGEGNGYPPPEFWPGESHGQRNLAGCEKSDRTEPLTLSLSSFLGNHKFSCTFGSILIISEETEAQSGRQIWPMSPSRDITEPFWSMLGSRYGRREILDSSVSGAEPMRYPEKSS